MKFVPVITVAFCFPLTSGVLEPAVAAPFQAGPPVGMTSSDVRPAQYRVYDYSAPRPAPELREFIDRNGNRVFVDEYGDVVSVVPPAGQQGSDWGRPEQPGFAERPAPVPEDPYYNQRPVEPEYGLRSFPPPPGGGVERAPLPAPGTANAPTSEPPATFDGGPRPYTPPSVAQEPAFDQPTFAKNKGTAEIAAVQIMLDRAGVSPGVIDGQVGSNVRKAMEAYEMKTGRTIDPDNIDQVMEELRASGGLPITQYTIAESDVAGPFLSSVPADYAEKAELDELSYTSPAEMIAERFHMDEGYLRAINPNADFYEVGTVIKVADTGAKMKASVSRIVADKSRKQVFAYDEGGALVAAYPATIGSRSTPSPTGTHQVERIAHDPNYTYNPAINFKQGDNDKVLTIPPGPNGPVGSVWIALSKPTYGIHGTPDPSKIGKTESNGCIRLTNWDAAELADMVKPGVTVEFVEQDGMLVSETEAVAPIGTTRLETEAFGTETD
ncbi:L,D-transpeptidase [Pararhizobium haloflavum]|uniref:L,D-transpeptidase n=1 Tax=Pararhizobium haloflavum TaxID=2037914 RepID=UPI000C19A29A|nr:L,D-transpeptidase [Pararhizobium haloflavum]